MRKFAIALALLCSISSAQAVSLRGVPSCGVWVEDRGKQNSWGAIAYGNWLIGYLSGVAVSLQSDFIKGTDNESLFLFVDNYCRANPLDHINDAANALAEKLRKQKGV